MSLAFWAHMNVTDLPHSGKIHPSLAVLRTWTSGVSMNRGPAQWQRCRLMLASGSPCLSLLSGGTVGRIVLESGRSCTVLTSRENGQLQRPKEKVKETGGLETDGSELETAQPPALGLSGFCSC